MKRTAMLIAPFIFLPAAVAHAASGAPAAGMNFIGWYLLSRVALVGGVLLVMFVFKKKE